jgi:hypothetical protein
MIPCNVSLKSGAAFTDIAISGVFRSWKRSITSDASFFHMKF